MDKVILILVDGMRPDAMEKCGNKHFSKILENSTYCLNTQTELPAITLPCHFSLFYSVPMSRHGITTNIFIPLARPLPGIFEQLYNAQKRNGMFYNWAQLRDLAHPDTYEISYFNKMIDDSSDNLVAKTAINEIKQRKLDFSFVYLGETDEVGHHYGWMGKEYLQCVDNAINRIYDIIETFPDYHIIITADHGGHDRCHGCNIPEDMTIPLILMGDKFKKDYILAHASILDIAPTIVDIMEVNKAKEWEGKSLINN